MSTSSSSDIDLGNYEILSDFALEYAPVTITKYRSKKTGFQVVVGNHKAPITNASFVLATEIFDDSGRPHTLEHLIFLGSKSYPYKGVLDRLANRAGGNGTNAWTADDHTAYTISTAGTEGFLNLLPIFLEHILYPTITKEGFITEVYHINGKGEEGGVVWCEMQGVQQQSTRVLMRQLQLEMYPTGSAYRSETGGMLDPLRKLTVEEIRDFHANTYKPWNVCLHVDGSIPMEQLMRILNDTVDPMILANTKSDGDSAIPSNWKRPFLETPSAAGPVIEKNVRKVVPFMDKDETVGEVVVAWKGTKTGDHLEEMALDILTTYLTHSAVAPLNKRFIEIANPACTSIRFCTENRASHCEITCCIHGVNNVDHAADSERTQLDKMDEELKEALREIVKAGVDMERIKAVIERARRQLLSNAETNVTGVLEDAVIGDFLYGDKNGKGLEKVFDDLKWYNTLLGWRAEKWSDLITRLFIDSPSIAIIGQPSASLAEKITKEQAELLEATKTRLGSDGLAAKEAELEKAQKENDREIPESMITGFPISDAGKIDWIPVESGVNAIDGTSAKAGKVQAHLDQDGDKLPYFVHYSHVESNFISIRATIDTTVLPAELMPYVGIYEASLFALAVQRSDGLLNHEEVVRQLTELTVSYHAGLGIRGDFPEVLQIVLNVEKHRYQDAIAWLRDLLSKSIFDKERLAVAIAKLVQDLPRRKRGGYAIACATASSIGFDETKSTSTATGLYNNLTFLPKVAEEIKNQPDAVVEKLQRLRELLLNPQAMRLTVAGDVMEMSAPRTAWAKNFLQMAAVELSPLMDSRSTLSKLGQAPAEKAVIVPMPSIESSFGVAYGKGPHGWNSEEVITCKLAAGVLNAYESYLWMRIRGAGLGYHSAVGVDEEHGLVTFVIYRSPDAFKAFEAAGKLLLSLADGTTELDENVVNAAKSTMSYTFAKREGNIDAAASTVLLNEVFKNIPADAGAKTLARLKDITVEQVRQAMIKYFVPLFDPNSSFIAVACAPGLTDKIQSSLKEIGYDTEIRELPGAGEGEKVEDDEMAS